MADTDISYEEIQSKLRLLRRPAAHRRQAPRQQLSSDSEYGHAALAGTSSQEGGHDALAARFVPRGAQSTQDEGHSAPKQHAEGPASSPGASPRCSQPGQMTHQDTGSYQAYDARVCTGASGSYSLLGMPPPAAALPVQVVRKVQKVPRPGGGALGRGHHGVGDHGGEGGSRHEAGFAGSLPASPGASPSSASSGSARLGAAEPGHRGGGGAGSAGIGPRRDDSGVHYLTQEELQPFARDPEDRFIGDVLRRLGGSEWSEQFTAIDDARRLVHYAPKSLALGGHLRKTAALITTLIDSLRSALAKNALRCMGEMFATFGKRMDPEIELTLPVVMKRASDTNGFIADEAEGTLREVCKVATEAKLLPSLMTAVANRQPRFRERSIWCVAMFVQRLRLRGPGSHGREHEQLRSAAEAINKALGDANADVRQSARVAAITIMACCGTMLDECMIGPRIASAVIPGVDPFEFDVFDADAVLRCAELARMAGLSSGPTAATGLRSVRPPGAVPR